LRRVSSIICSADVPKLSSSAAPSPEVQRTSIDSVASGWNCVAKLRPTRHACGPTSLRANSSACGGTVTASECHCSHGPGAITSGTSETMSYQPISGMRARSTVPPSASAIAWFPKQIPNCGTPRACASPIRAHSAATFSATCGQ
jgi:hypothetical protein